MCGGRDGPLTADHRSRGLRRPGPESDGGKLERPHQFIHCVNPRPNLASYLFDNTRFVMLKKLKEDTHLQVRAQLQRGLLKCKCGFTPKMKLSRTTKNYNSVFELWELSARTRTLWLFPMAPWPAVASPRASATVPETMGQRNTPWEWSLLQGSCPPPEKALSGHWERRSHRWPPTLGVALWESTLVGVGISISRSRRKKSNRQWSNQFAESAAAQEGEAERTRYFQSKFGSGTLF